MAPQADVHDSSPRTRRIAVTVVFFLVGCAAGSWAARLPAIKAHLHISAGVLGLALLGSAVGAVMAMTVVGAVLVKIKPRRIVAVMFVPYALALCVLSFVDSPWQLFATLVVWGAAVGTIDVAMNVEAAALQDLVGRRIMSRFHAAYSLGGLAGAGGGALAAATGLSVRANFLIVGVSVLTVGVVASSAFSRTPVRPIVAPASESPVRSPRRPKLSWSLVGLCTIAFGCFLAEGAVNNWSAIYLHSSLKAGAGLAAVAYTCLLYTSGGSTPRELSVTTSPSSSQGHVILHSVVERPDRGDIVSRFRGADIVANDRLERLVAGLFESHQR